MNPFNHPGNLRVPLLLLAALAAPCCSSLAGTPPDFSWALTAGGADLADVETVGSAVAADKLGNVFVGGLLSGPSSFGTNLIGAPGSSAIFLAKYGANGQVQWAKAILSGSRLECNAVVADGNGGVCVAGAAELAFHDNARCMFVRKYDSGGNLVWTNSAGPVWTSIFSGPAGEATGFALAMGPTGDTYVAGTFIGQPAFGSSNVLFAGVFAHAGGGVLVTNFAGTSGSRPNDGFLAKYAPDGKFQWVRTFGGTNDDHAYGVSAGADGSVWVTGSFQREGRFGVIGVVSTNDSLGDEMFVAKYDAAGSPTAVVASSGEGARRVGCAIAADSINGAFVAGRFTAGVLALGGLAITNKLSTASFAPYTDTFLARLDSAGGVAWIKLIDRQTGGYATDKSAVGLTLDSNGTPVLTGSFNDRVLFDSYQFASPPPSGIFVAKYGASGLFDWAVSANALRVSGQEWTSGGSRPLFVGNTVAADGLGNLYLTGAFRADALDPTVFGPFVLTSHTDPFSVPSYDLFLTKLGTGTNPPQGPRLGLLQLLPGGIIRIQVLGEAGQVAVQRSSNLNSWDTFTTNTVDAGFVTFSDSQSAQPGPHFYRCFMLP